MRKFIGYLFLLYMLALAALWFGRFAAIYPFDPTKISPNDAGVPSMQAHVLSSFDNTKLIVWVKPPQSGKPTIAYFHGNAGNLAMRAPRFERLIERGYGVIAMAYRGSSGSQGSPSQTSITKDSQFLIENLTQLGFHQKSNLIYYGESLGTGVAIQLAKSHPPTAMILEAPFTSITDLAAKQFPIFPIRQIMDQNWNSLSAIYNINVPLLILHGQEDKLIPFTHGQSIYNASPSRNKTLEIMRNTSHNDIWSVNGQKILYKFLKNLKIS
jgi:pimeloyl-ACP methyl ester carboxylesterase